jgi:hypothetical protein
MGPLSSRSNAANALRTISTFSSDIAAQYLASNGLRRRLLGPA